MFSKILIANWGEIACRAILTARKAGVKTVAVYPIPEMESNHVELEDEAANVKKLENPWRKHGNIPL